QARGDQRLSCHQDRRDSQYDRSNDGKIGVRFHRARRNDRVRRREFVTQLGNAAATWPLVARAQEPERRRIGGLLRPAADDLEYQGRMAAFQQALQQLGWTDARNVRIDTPCYDARSSRDKAGRKSAESAASDQRRTRKGARPKT